MITDEKVTANIDKIVARQNGNGDGLTVRTDPSIRGTRVLLAPLATWICKEEARTGSLSVVAARLGVDASQCRRWSQAEDDETIALERADEALTNAGVPLWEVYPSDDASTAAPAKARTAECAGCGVTFEIGGRGRMPKYHDSDCRAKHDGKAKGRSTTKPLRGSKSTPLAKTPTPKAPAPDDLRTGYAEFLLARFEADPTPLSLARLLAFEPAPSDAVLDRIESAIGGAA